MINMRITKEKKSLGEIIILFPFMLLSCFLVCLSTTGFISIGHKIDIDYMRLFYVALLLTLFSVIANLDLDGKMSWISLCLVSAGTGFLLYSLHSNKELIVLASILLFIRLFSFIISSIKKEDSSHAYLSQFITMIISIFAAAYAVASLIFPTVSFGTVFGYQILSQLLFFIGVIFFLLLLGCLGCCLATNIATRQFSSRDDYSRRILLSNAFPYGPPQVNENEEDKFTPFSGDGYPLGRGEGLYSR